MKQVVLNMSQRRMEPDNLKASHSSVSSRTHGRDPFKPSVYSSTRARSKSPTRHSQSGTGGGGRSAVYQPRHYVEAEFDDTNVHKPPPTEFVSD